MSFNSGDVAVSLEAPRELPRLSANSLPSILSFNPSHDGAIAWICDGKLRFSLEAEKDSHARHERLKVPGILEALGQIEGLPEAIAIGGWTGFFAGYSGIEQIYLKKARMMGSSVSIFSSSHERSHLMCAYAMSPYQQGEPCYSLLWEGTIGRFYKFDEKLNIRKFPMVMTHPGWRYSYLYYLGMNSSPVLDAFWGKMEMAGKLMALAGVPSPANLAPEEAALIAWILKADDVTAIEASIPEHLPSDKSQLPFSSNLINVGVESPNFRNVAHHFSNAIFDAFHGFAEDNLTERLPLIISGGCGLNCDWNTKWKNSDLFSSVFVPPCANDSGSAIGSAVDAQFALSGNAKVQWDVYAGQSFVRDMNIPQQWASKLFDLKIVASLLKQGLVVAWVQGRCEIGPRALGHRSLFAEPFSANTCDLLNTIKKREKYRPVAPICLEEDISLHFNWNEPSPYMLYFQSVIDPSLKAIRHCDGSARVQTVNANQSERTYNLLREFKALTGKGVLCNTSLNFNGRGFINRTSDLFRFMDEHRLHCAVIDDTMIIRQPAEDMLKI